MAEWYPGATRRDGPAQKQGYPSAKSPPGGPKKGLVGHSMEGSLAAALGELDNPNRQASWTWSNPKVGKLLQHYPASAHTWASGGFQANVDFCPIENEGVAGEPLNQNQIDNLVGLLKWLGPTFGWAGYVRGVTLWEHREMTQFGSAPTACPSGRIPWDTIIAALEDDDMTPEECKQAMKEVLTDPNAFPELAGKSVIQQIQASDNWILNSIGGALDLAAENLKAK